MKFKFCSAVLFCLQILFVSSGVSQTVTLPLTDFEALRQRSVRTSPSRPPAPAPVVFESAELAIFPSEESARVVQTMRLAIYEDGFHQVPIPALGNLTSVELGTLEGRVQVSEQGRRLLIRGRGQHVVTMESVISVEKDDEATRPTRTLSLELPTAGLVHGSVSPSSRTVGDASGEPHQVEASAGALIIGVPEQPDGSRRFVALPGARAEFKLLGEPIAEIRTADPTGLPLQFSVDSASLLHVERERVSLVSRLRMKVEQGVAESLQLVLPDGYRVADVQPASLGWAEIERGGDRVLSLVPRAAVSDELSVTLRLIGESSPEFSVPVLLVDGAYRSKVIAGISIEVGGIPVIVDTTSARALSRLESSTLPTFLQNAPRRVFVVSDPERPPRFAVEWSESEMEVLAAQIDRLVVDLVYGEPSAHVRPPGAQIASLRAAYQCWVSIRSAGATKVTLQMPAGFELFQVSRDAFPVTAGQSPKGLEIPLAGGAGPQWIHLVGTAPIEPLASNGVHFVPLPAASVPIVEVEVRAIAPASRTYSIDAPHIVSVPYEPDRPGFDVGGRPASVFEIPEGFTRLGARFSPMDVAPKPLPLIVEKKSTKRRWF